MPKKRRRKGDPRNDTGDFQMMDIDDFNPSSSVPTTASTSTTINISQWDIDGDRIHGKSSLASIEDPTMAVSAPLASDSTTHDQATFDYNFDAHDQATLDYNFDADEDIISEEEPSAKRSFIGVS